MEQIKKSIYKKWWFWLLVIILILLTKQLYSYASEFGTYTVYEAWFESDRINSDFTDKFGRSVRLSEFPNDGNSLNFKTGNFERYKIIFYGRKTIQRGFSFDAGTIETPIYHIIQLKSEEAEILSSDCEMSLNPVDSDYYDTTCLAADGQNISGSIGGSKTNLETGTVLGGAYRGPFPTTDNPTIKLAPQK